MISLKRSFAVTKVHCTGLESVCASAFLDKLKTRMFRPCDDLPELRAWGWSPVDNIDAQDFSPEHFLGEYVLFSFRLDSRKIPAALKKKELDRRINEEKEKCGVSFVKKARKAELMELTMNALIPKIPFIPSSTTCIFSVKDQNLWILSNKESMVDLIREYLIDTFQISDRDRNGNAALSVYSQYNAIEKAGADDIDITPTPFGPDVTFNSRLSDGLASDYLAWIVSDHAAIAEHEDISIYLDNTISLSSPDRMERSSYKIEKEDAKLSEIKIAMSQSKIIEAGTIVIESPNTKWRVKISGNVFTPNITFPKVKIDKDEDAGEGSLFEQIYLLETCWELLSSSFETFLKKRNDKREWRGIRDSISTWAASY